VARTLRQYLISAEADAALERWACSAMKGVPQTFPATPSVSPEWLLRYTEFHGITALVYAQTKSAANDCLPDGRAVDALRRAATHQAARELLLHQELGEVLDSATARGLTPLILKGTALAYSLYSEPALRGRNDTDLQIATTDKATMTTLLEQSGYEGDLIAGEHWATSERSFTKHLSHGITSRIDVHWRINNSPMFWHEELGHQRLIAQAQPLEKLHAKARCPGFGVMLLHACIHRATHVRAPLEIEGTAYVAANRLVWLFDVHLLAHAMNADQWSGFSKMARDLGVCGLCRAAFDAAALRFGTRVPESILSDLARAAPEAATEHLEARSWRIKLTEFRVLPSNTARLGWLREHLLPSRAYMRARYPLSPRMPLALLYLKRLLPLRRSS
jgi:hypothetical protein